MGRLILSLLRVAVLVDLPRTPLSGGHVKGWERRAHSAAASNLPVDLTIYFSGQDQEERIGPNVRFRSLPPIFSTEKLKSFLYFPDHTDLAPFHPTLARELSSYDIIHTTDGYFNFARTAEKVSKKHHIPLVTSIHTATPEYAYIFTKNTIEEKFGKGRLSYFLNHILDLPARQQRRLENRLRHHLGLCNDVLVVRQDDRKLAETILGKDHVFDVRTCINKNIFNPNRRDRKALLKDHTVPNDRVVVLFVGRVDIGKNIYTLIEAMEHLIADDVPVHLMVAGVGPAEADIRHRLGARATLLGFVGQDDLARLYASVDVLALCSEVEVRGFVGVEAIASGCPVLVSEKSGIAPLFHNTGAMTVVSGQAEGWANALRLFVDSPEQRERMRAETFIYSEKNFISWEDQLEGDFLRVWRSAASRRCPSHEMTSAQSPTASSADLALEADI